MPWRCVAINSQTDRQNALFVREEVSSLLSSSERLLIHSYSTAAKIREGDFPSHCKNGSDSEQLVHKKLFFFFVDNVVTVTLAPADILHPRKPTASSGHCNQGKKKEKEKGKTC